MDKTILDNMSGQELKEMIDNEIITLEELDNTALGKIMNFEIEMLCFGSADMITIRRCAELLDERNKCDELNKEKFMAIIRRAEKEHVVIIDDNKQNENNTKDIKRKHTALRRISLVAAIMAVLMSVTVLVAAAFGINIFEYISRVVRQDEGSQIMIDDFTFYHNGEAKRYSSIEEMVAEEQLHIMYPSKLPEGVLIDKVVINQDENGNDLIHISTNNKNICIAIETNFQMPNITDENSCIYNHNGLTYYIFQENTFFATCEYKNCCYSIQTKSYDELIYIIDNMKE